MVVRCGYSPLGIDKLGSSARLHSGDTLLAESLGFVHLSAAQGAAHGKQHDDAQAHLAEAGRIGNATGYACTSVLAPRGAPQSQSRDRVNMINLWPAYHERSPGPGYRTNWIPVVNLSRSDQQRLTRSG